MQTYMPRMQDAERAWLKVDVSGEILGRVAARVASLLRGKHKPVFTPHVDVGDFVIVVNVEKVKVTGKKMQQRTFDHYTGHMGGLRRIPMEDLFRRNPGRVFRLAVQRMLPKTRMGRELIRKLKVYKGSDHPHRAQNPADYALTGKRLGKEAP